MADEKPTEPVFDPVRIRVLIVSSKSHVMLPGGELINEMATQMGLALKEVETSSSRIHRAETDLTTLKAQTDADRRIYADLRAENEALKARLPAPKSTAAGEVKGARVPRVRKAAAPPPA